MSIALFQNSGSKESKANKIQGIENISFQYGLLNYTNKSVATTIIVGVSYGRAKYRGGVFIQHQQAIYFLD